MDVPGLATDEEHGAFRPEISYSKNSESTKNNSDAWTSGYDEGLDLPSQHTTLPTLESALLGLKRSLVNFQQSSLLLSRPLPRPRTSKMPNPSVPKPGPANLTKNAGLEQWLEEAKQCHYLPEAVMKQLCEMVKECLMEGMRYHYIIRDKS